MSNAQPSTNEAYQPISGWAIAGFITSGLFAILVAISTVVALIQGAPMFFPMWILTLAILGIVLSLVGHHQVQTSEGTRAGAKLARIGVWLSLVSGLGYLSYYYVTALALESQANAFLMEKGEDTGFFPLMLEGAASPVKTNAAFLMTMPAYARNCRPDNIQAMAELHDPVGKDGSPGPLSQFKDGMIARLFSGHLAKDAEITPGPVQSWTYEKRSYTVIRTYHVKTQEAEIDLQMMVSSTEAESAGQGRKWWVDIRKSGPLKAMTLTPTGEGIRLLRQHAHGWLTNRITEINNGDAYPAIIQKDKTDWNLIDDKDGEIRAVWKNAFTGSGKNRIVNFKVVSGTYEVGVYGKWSTAKAQIQHYFRCVLPKEPGASSCVYTLDGEIFLETARR